jgi:ACT domain-containing protein
MQRKSKKNKEDNADQPAPFGRLFFYKYQNAVSLIDQAGHDQSATSHEDKVARLATIQDGDQYAQSNITTGERPVACSFFRWELHLPSPVQCRPAAD